MVSLIGKIVLKALTYLPIVTIPLLAAILWTIFPPIRAYQKPLKLPPVEVPPPRKISCRVTKF